MSYKWALIRTFCLMQNHYLKCLFRKYILNKKTNYNSTHHGYLPIRVLTHNTIHWLETASPEFFQLLLSETNYNGLQKGIGYNINKLLITDAANIDSLRKINLYENYNAYLWCISYALFVVFDESIQKPHLRGNYDGKIDKNNFQIENAIKLFDYAMGLRNNFNDWDKSLPNPENYDCRFAYYIEKTNGLYVSALYFTICHEVGHSYFNHVTYTPATSVQSIQQEYDADNFAIDTIKNNSNKPLLPTLKYGAVVGMCALLFLDPKLSGGGSHPDMDDRIKNAMERLEFEDLNLCWGIAALAFKLWGNLYGKTYPLPAINQNYKTMLYHTLEELAKTK